MKLEIKRSIKIIVKYISIFILLFMIVNAIYLLVKESIHNDLQFDDNKVSATGGNKSDNNFVLYTVDNGLKTAPFIFGERLYIYSVNDDKSYLLQNSKKFGSSYSRSMSLMRDCVYYKFDEDSVFNVLNINNKENTDTGLHFQLDEEYENSYVVYKDNIIYLKNNKNQALFDICMFDLANKRTSILKRNVGYINKLYVSNNNLYFYKTDKKSKKGISKFYRINLDSKVTKSFSLSDNVIPEYFYEIDNNKLLILNRFSKNIIEYDCNTFNYRDVSSNNSIDCKYIENALSKKGDFIYYINSDMYITRLNYNTGYEKKVFNINSIFDYKVKKDEYFDVSIEFSTDYIFIDLTLFSDDSYILIIDYDGNIIKKINKGRYMFWENILLKDK